MSFELDKGQKLLQQLVHFRTYAATKPGGFKESVSDSILRVETMHRDRFPLLADEIGEAFDEVYAGRVVPSMRQLQFGGLPILKENIRGFNCFSSDTEITTPLGIKSFSDCKDGDEVVVLADKHQWKKAIVHCFGEQRLYKLTLSRCKTTQVIYTTADHNWFRHKKIGHTTKHNLRETVKTTELVKGDVLPTNRLTIDLTSPCKIAIQHGIVFGDGTYVKRDGSCSLELCNKKQQLLPLMTAGNIKIHGSHGGKTNENQTRISDLPYNWKELPSLTANKDYLVGFIMGWFATDGSNTGSSSISSSIKENLVWLRNACSILGIGTSSIRMTREISPYDGSYSPEYQIILFKDRLFKEFFLRTEHSDNFEPPERNLYWNVVSVEETDRIEPVWCVTEPTTGTFTLGCGILTKNCSYHPVLNFKTIADFFYISMCGSGCGYSIQRMHTKELPVIKYGNAEARFVIPDSKEGWSDSLFAILENPRVQFDYSEIRPAGSPLSSGGTASGPQALQTMHGKVRSVLLKATDRQLRPIEVHDVVCHMLDAVVVGGSRRSSAISLFDADDEEMLVSKTGNWFDTNPQRARANNSAVLYRNDPKAKQKFNNVFDKMTEGGWGEPGFLWSNSSELGVNPCQTLDYTNLLKKEATGEVHIAKLRDVEIGDEIWSGHCWTKVTNKWKTGTKKIYKYITSCNYFIGTDNHLVMCNGFKTEVGLAESIDVITGCLPAQISETMPEVIMDGLVLGDGTLHKASNKGCLIIGEKDQDYFQSEIKPLIIAKSKICPGAHSVVTSITKEELVYTYNRVIPDRFFFGSVAVKCNFLRGIFSANGCVTNCGRPSSRRCRVQFKTSSRKLAEQVQEMLSSLGMRSSLVTNKPTPTQHRNGVYTSKESYNIILYNSSEEYMKYIGFIQKYKTKEVKNSIPPFNTSVIRQIIELPEEDVYDITVDDPTHCFWCSGSWVSNCNEARLLSFCNLTEINVAACKTPAEFFEAAKAATLIGTLQASYTNFHYIAPDWKEKCEYEALLGVSLTGQALNWDLLAKDGVLHTASNILLNTNETMAKKLGINLAHRIGLVKPSGSTSAWLGCTSGIHAAHSPYYFRRVRIDISHPIAQYLLSIYKLGEPDSRSFLESDKFNASNIIVTIPMRSTPNAIQREKETALELLERDKFIYNNWIKSTHRIGEDTHNISITVNYRKEELEDIRKWMWENRDCYAGISLFPMDDNKYIQMPFEGISKASYYRKYSELADLDFSALNYNNVLDERIGEAACGGGGCEFR